MGWWRDRVLTLVAYRQNCATYVREIETLKARHTVLQQQVVAAREEEERLRSCIRDLSDLVSKRSRHPVSGSSSTIPPAA